MYKPCLTDLCPSTPSLNVSAKVSLSICSAYMIIVQTFALIAFLIRYLNYFSFRIFFFFNKILDFFLIIMNSPFEAVGV